MRILNLCTGKGLTNPDLEYLKKEVESIQGECQIHVFEEHARSYDIESMLSEKACELGAVWKDPRISYIKKTMVRDEKMNNIIIYEIKIVA